MNGTLNQLAVFLEQSKPLAEQYGRKDDYMSLSKVLEHGRKKELVLLVCGEFKRGKSSFVNALLGQDLCPVADGIATSTVSIIQYGEKAKAVRHYSVIASNESNEEALSMREEEVSFDQIARFAKGTSEEIGNTMFIEIEVPNSLLKDGLVVIDTPGVGSLDPRHLFLTLQALPKADAFFFVTDTGEPLTTTELSFIKERLVPTGKPFNVLLAKSDMVSRDELARYVDDTEKKVLEFCGVKVSCTPVSSTEWDSFNKSGNERRRVNSNCEAVYSAINSFKVSREHYFAEKFKEQYVAYLEALKSQALGALEAVKVIGDGEVEKLKQRLNGLNSFKNAVINDNSEFRLKINSIIESSQEKVMQEFSRESVLLSTDKLSSILSESAAAEKGGEKYVLDKVNGEIRNLSDSLDRQINCALEEVMEELRQYISSPKHEVVSFDGGITSLPPIEAKKMSDRFFNFQRNSLPFMGVATIGGTAAGVVTSIFSVAAVPYIAIPAGIAAGIFYVVKAIKGTRKTDTINQIRQQISPRITIAMNELRAYIQKRYNTMQKEVVNSLRAIAENMTQQMQETVKMLQECQSDNQKKNQKTNEIESELKLIDTLATQVKLLGSNPFARK